MTAYFASRGLQHTDTGIYHAQAIRWYEEYGLVKGLGNLQQHFAYNSAYLAYAACLLYTSNATPSFGEVLKTALAVTKETWQLWQGTWFSIFLMTLMPGVFGEKWYFLTTLLMAGMLGGGICMLMHTVLCRYISRAKENRYLRGICTLTVLFLTFQTFVSPVLALYWYNGSLHYVFMEAVPVSYTHLYTDFDGCMDIVLGISECFGIRLPENFSAPFLSRSIEEYWRRWHISPVSYTHLTHRS